MNASLIAFLAVPLITGAASSIWAPITKLTLNGMAALNAVSYSLVWLTMLMFRKDDPGLFEAARTIGWWPILSYVALSAAVSISWFVAQHDTHVFWIAVGEMAWPMCVLGCTLMLARWTSLPVQAPTLSLWHALWGVLIVTGVVGLAAMEAKA